MSETWKAIFFFWSPFYGGPILLATYILLLGISLYHIVKQKKIDLLGTALILYFSGSVVYFLLFFGAFQHHDYYLIVLLTTIPLVLWYLGARITSRGVVILSIVVLYGIFHARAMNQKRFEIWAHENPPAPFYEAQFRDEIEEHIPESAIILVPEDVTPNKWLYFLRRRGYSGFDLGVADYGKLPEPARLDEIMRKGVTHIVLTNRESLPLYQAYIDTLPLMEYKRVFVYKRK